MRTRVCKRCGKNFETNKSELPKSGITGVTARKNGSWQACYKTHYIGVYATVEEAAAAIEEYKSKLNTEQ